MQWFSSLRVIKANHQMHPKLSTLLLGTPPAPEHVCDISGLMVIVFEMMDDDCFYHRQVI